MTRKMLIYIAGIIIALGISAIMFTLIVGVNGLDGPSFVKEQLWKGINNTYTQVYTNNTESLGYGNLQRSNTVWEGINNGVAYKK